MDDIAAGVEWLRNNKRIKNSVFIGNWGVGSLMAAYTAPGSILSRPRCVHLLERTPWWCRHADELDVSVDYGRE